MEIDVESLKKNNSNLLVNGKKIAFGVDSFEDYKMWYEEDFIKLADLLFEKKLFDYIYLVSVSYTHLTLPTSIQV